LFSILSGTLSVLTHKLIEMGASSVYVAASHGLFTEHAHDLIRDTPVQKVVVTNSLPLPKNASSKIVQVSVAPLLARLILMEHFRSRRDEDHYFIDEE
jgi:ribose-phosphate pyrophosphokinase